MKNKLLIITLLIGLNCQAQEYLSGFSYETNDFTESRNVRSRGEAMQLPFFEDFTDSVAYTDALKW